MDRLAAITLLHRLHRLPSPVGELPDGLLPLLQRRGASLMSATVLPFAPGVTFDEAAHRYFVDGKELPSVTHVLQAVGMVDYTFSTEYAMERGSAAHKAIHFDVEGDLDESDLDPRLAPYVLAARCLRRDIKAETVGVERRLYSPTLRYAGTLDYLFKIEGVLSILDWKCSQSPAPATALQVAAYAAAYEEETGEKIRRRYCAALSPRGTYELIPYTDRDDISVFRSALAVYHWRSERGLL